MRCLLPHILLVAVSLVSNHPLFAAPTARPNVLLIMTDDQGWGDLSLHGNRSLKTPVLDRLAGQGAQFDRFYVSPVCAPTRASLLTGRYHLRTGVTNVTRGQESMRADEVTIAEVFKQAGYTTGCFGKWHNGAQYPRHPNGQGFDEFMGFCGGHWNNYFDTPLERNGRSVPTSGYITDVLTDAAVDFIRRKKDAPFFCYIPFNAPHGPFQVPDRYFDNDAGKVDDKTAAVYGMCENIDGNVGRLLGTLAELGLRDNTIVVFLTDNGPNGARFNGGMRGTKGSAHEGGVRVPCFIRWPGRIKPGVRVERIAAHIDMLPTLADLCGVSTEGTKSLDGTSLAPLLLSRDVEWQDRILFSHYGSRGTIGLKKGAARTQQYRLVIEKGDYELYDMQADPEQKKNIINQQPEVAKSLKSAYEAWHADVVRSGRLKTPDGVLRMPIPVGHPQARTVKLPATEAYFNGGIKYENGAGFAHDWLTGWTSTDETILWDINVARAGTYEVVVKGTYPESSLGTTLRAAAGALSCETQLQFPWSPEPTIRPDRSEAYRNRKVQDFAPRVIGLLQLEEGRQDLTLSAADAGGASIADVESVTLEFVAPQANYPPEFDDAIAVPYKPTADGALNAWIFRPAGHQPGQRRPAAIFFFGGGWKQGNPAQFEQHCRYLALRGMVAITADYRVARRHGTTAAHCVADAKSAIRWMRRNARQLGIDPNRIVAGGGSAGGHLAACTATIHDFDEPGEDATVSAVPNATALFNPALVLAPIDGWQPFDRERMAGMPSRAGTDPQRISPFHHVASGQPPTIIFHGTADSTVLFETAERFTRAMHEAGNRCELKGFEGANHGFFNVGRGDGSAFRKTIDHLDDFLVSLGYLPELEPVDEN